MAQQTATADTYTDAGELVGALSAGGDATPVVELQGLPLEISGIIQQGERQDGSPYAVAEARVVIEGQEPGDTVSFFIPGKRLFPILNCYFAEHPTRPVRGFLLKDPTVDGKKFSGWQLLSLKATVQLDHVGRYIVTLNGDGGK